MSDVNAVVQQQAARAHPPVTYIEHGQSLGTAQGGYTAFITNAAGPVVNVRTPDGTHLTPGGGQVAAQQVINELPDARLPHLGRGRLRPSDGGARGATSAGMRPRAAPSPAWERRLAASAPTPARPGRT